MGDHGRQAPALGPPNAAGEGFEDQADKAQQLHCVLPDRVYCTADASQHLNAGGLFRLFDRYAKVIQGAVDGLEQGTVGGCQGAVSLFGRMFDARRAQQLHQQRGAGGIQRTEAVEVNAGAGVILAVECGRQLLQVGIVGQRPVAGNP